MDVKVLQFQNKKLVERIEQRRKAEEQLKQRIEQLEQRQTTDDAVLCIVNRYWNQVSHTRTNTHTAHRRTHTIQTRTHAHAHARH